MAGNVTGLHTFGADAGPEPLSNLDLNYGLITTSLNSLSTFTNSYADSGSVNSLVVTVPAPQVFTYTAGIQVTVAPVIKNTGATTINVNSLGAKPVLYQNGSALTGGELQAGAYVTLTYSTTLGGFTIDGGFNSLVPPVVIPAPASGTSLTVNGAAGANPVFSVISGSSASAAVNDVYIQRAGSTANARYKGPNIGLFDTASGNNTTIQNSGGQTEFWQFNGVSDHQLAFWNSNYALTLNTPSAGSALTVNGLSGASAVAVLVSGTSGGYGCQVAASAGGTANTQGTGSGILLNSTGVGTNIQNSGGQTEIWQFNGAWNQAAFWNSDRALTLNASASTSPTLTVNQPSASRQAINVVGNGASTISLINLANLNTQPLFAVTNAPPTGSATPTLANNKPGSSTSTAGWLNILVAGVTCYVPYWN